MLYRGNHLGVVLASNPRALKESICELPFFFPTLFCFWKASTEEKSLNQGIISCFRVFFCSNSFILWVEMCGLHGMQVPDTSCHLGQPQGTQRKLLPPILSCFLHFSPQRANRPSTKKPGLFCLIPVHMFSALLIYVRCNVLELHYKVTLNKPAQILS